MSTDLNPRESYGQLFFLDNTIESISGNVDIQIGLTESTADLILNRNVLLARGKTLSLEDHSAPYNRVALSMANGVLVIGTGGLGLRVGDVEIYQDTIESTAGNTNFKLGNPSATANLVIGRNTVMANGKTLTIGSLTGETVNVVSLRSQEETLLQGSTEIQGPLTLTGNFAHIGLDIESVNYITVTTAGTYAASTTNSKNILIYTGGAVNVTWTMPPNPVDGQVCSWTNSANSTSVFFITAGATLVPSISGPYSPGTKFQYVYRASTNTWHDLP